MVFDLSSSHVEGRKCPLLPAVEVEAVAEEALQAASLLAAMSLDAEEVVERGGEQRVWRERGEGEVPGSGLPPAASAAWCLWRRLPPG